MKKLLSSALVLLALAGGILTAEAPVFDKPNAYIIDTKTISGELKDHVKVTNVSQTSNFEVSIFGWHEVRQEWLEFGKTRLYSLGDKQTIKSVDKYNRALSKFRYLAVANSEDKKFKYSLAAAKKDLNIWFYDDREIDPSHFKVFDTTILPQYSGDLKIIAGKNLIGGASFRIEAYNEKDEEAKTGTTAVLKGAKASESFETASNGKKFGTYKYIKIISREEKDFNYTANVHKNDLIITVNP